MRQAIEFCPLLHPGNGVAVTVIDPVDTGRQLPEIPLIDLEKVVIAGPVPLTQVRNDVDIRTIPEKIAYLTRHRPDQESPVHDSVEVDTLARRDGIETTPGRPDDMEVFGEEKVGSEERQRGGKAKQLFHNRIPFGDDEE
jgi:hypothetical protein